MNSGNDETKSMLMIVGFIGAAIWIAAIFVFAVAAFIAFCLTVLCLFAWEREIKLGKFVLGPQEARPFVYRGLAGGVLLPVFIAFCVVLFGFKVIDAVWGWAALVGYIGGSLGVEIWKAQQAQNAPPEPEILPPQINPPPSPPPQRLPSPEAKPFRFASWDDEEARR